MSGRLTTHVLDLAQGKPAAGMALQLWRFVDITPVLLCEAITNSDGRLDAPLLAGDELLVGSYELIFMAGDYFRGNQAAPGESAVEASRAFLEHIPIRFNILDSGEHYHVPLLVAPGGYSTYRGS